MDQLTTNATSAGGLGTRPARWAFLFLWACAVLQGMVDGTLAGQPLLWTVALGAALVGTLLLTTPGSQLLRPPAATGVVLCACVLTVVALSSAPAVSDLWAVDLAAYVVTFLIVRGNAWTGGIGSALVPGIAAVWAWPQDPSWHEWIQLLGIPLGSVLAAVAWRLVLRWVVQRERVHRSAAAQAAERAAADAEALATASAELAAIRAEATPLLARIAAGEEPDDALRAELAFVEAGIRDRIRVPHLNHPDLVATIGRLRRRGVDVVLLGEANPGQQLRDGLAAAIVAAIAPVTVGRVTVRTLPQGRTAAASVVISDPEGSTAHLEFSATGQLLVSA